MDLNQLGLIVTDYKEKVLHPRKMPEWTAPSHDVKEVQKKENNLI